MPPKPSVSSITTFMGLAWFRGPWELIYNDARAPRARPPNSSARGRIAHSPVACDKVFAVVTGPHSSKCSCHNGPCAAKWEQIGSPAGISRVSDHENAPPMVRDGCLTVIITAGGQGRRLWPLSTPKRPKPFCRLIDEETLLEHSFRLAREITTPDHIFVVTSRDCSELVHENLPNLPRQNIVLEPAARGTTAAIGLATLHIAKRYPDSVCVVLASDHYLPNVAEFCDAIRHASAAAAAGANLVSVGVVPTFPYTGYGYMKCGSEWRPGSKLRIGLSYHEKPNATTAQRYIDEKNWLWNANIFVWSVTTILDAYNQYAQATLQRLKAAFDESLPERRQGADEIFQGIDSLSIDYEILEKIGAETPFHHLFLPYSGRWSDVGTFTILRSLLHGPDGNATAGSVIARGTHNCLMICERPYRLLADGTQDLDIVISQFGDILVRPAPSDAMDGIDPFDPPRIYERTTKPPRREQNHASQGFVENGVRGTISLNRVANIDLRVHNMDIFIYGRKHESTSLPIDLRITPDSDSATSHAADLLVDSLRESFSKRERSVFVPSVGRTTHNLFRRLRERHHDSLDWSRVVVVQMDEYVGLSCDHPESLAYRLREELVGPLGITKFLSVNDPDGRQSQAPDHYEETVKQLGGIDVILHGIGRNGHLGFNEPGASFDCATGNHTLHPETLTANFSGGRYPQGFTGSGFTLGLAVMASARRAILMALGSEKHRAIRGALNQMPGPELPATILRLHPDATFVVDHAAYFGAAGLAQDIMI
jgi:mannose-1-phosphate guanylyltransferase